MTQFKKFLLKDVAQVIDCPHSTPTWREEGIFVVRNYNLSNGKILKEKVSYVSEDEFLQRTKRARPTKGDIILSREAPIGSIGYINTDEPLCLGQRVVLIHPTKVDSKYLLYQLLSDKVQTQLLKSSGSGATVSNLRIPFIENIEIYAPEYSLQKKIGETISTYDDLVEKNEQSKQALNNTAQYIYIMLGLLIINTPVVKK